MTPAPPAPPPADAGDGLRLAVLIGYGLYAISPFTGGLGALGGVILAYIKRGEAAGTIWHGHCTWLIRTFWVGLLLMIAGAAVWGIIPLGALIGGAALIDAELTGGWLVAGALMAAAIAAFVFWIGGVIWMVYRIIKGALAAVDRKSLPNPAGLF